MDAWREGLKKRLIEEGFIRELEVNIVVPFHDCDEPADLELSKEIIAHRVKEYNNKNIFFTYLNFLFILLINWSSFCVSFRTGIRRSKYRPKKMKEEANADPKKWKNVETTKSLISTSKLRLKSGLIFFLLSAISSSVYNFPNPTIWFFLSTYTQKVNIFHFM